jgi:hypothetical protein
MPAEAATLLLLMLLTKIVLTFITWLMLVAVTVVAVVPKSTALVVPKIFVKAAMFGAVIYFFPRFVYL